MRVLVVKTSSLGDVLHTLPAVTDAAAAVPGVKIDWAVERDFAEIPGWHPSVDRVIPVDLRRWRRQPLQTWRSGKWRRCKRALQAAPYDAVIDAQGLAKSACLLYRLPFPRYGMDWSSVRERIACLAYDHRLSIPRNLHAVQRTRRLFALALDYTLPLSPARYGLSAATFSAVTAVPDTSRSLLFFHASARARKLWGEAHWCALRDLATAAGYQVLLPWGSPLERARAERIAGSEKNARVLPQMNLSELARLILDAKAAVAVDTGLGHLCAGLGLPTVSLYGPSSPALVGTCGMNQAHLRERCGELAAIKPLQVWRELEALGCE